MMPIFAEGSYAVFGAAMFAIFILGPITIGCLIAAIVLGMSRNEKKRRQSAKFLWVGVAAGLVGVLTPLIIGLFLD